MQSYGTHPRGRIEIICGSMFSGKTEEMIRRLRRAVIARQQVQAFKPAIDSRYHVEKVTSHDGLHFQAQPVSQSKDILIAVDVETDVVAIDEVQFFDSDIIMVCETLADRGKRVICAGLDQDFRGLPFGPMPELLARAEDVSKLHAVCVVCGEDACRTPRLIEGSPAALDDPVVLVGAAEVYEARCRKCHQIAPASALTTTGQGGR